MNDKPKLMVPKVRFKGFTDDWEQRKLLNFLTLSKIPGSNGQVAKKLTVKLWGKGVVKKDDPLSGSKNTKYFVRKKGQLMYGKLDFLHAAFGIVPDKLDGYESTLDSPAFDIQSNSNSNFLLEYFLRREFYLRNGERANGSRRAKRIHEKTFLNMLICIPNLKEQNKIGCLLKTVDATITLQQRKLKQLKMLKKALLQKIFADKDHLKPELRFCGFNDEWEQRKFKDVFSFEVSNNTLSRAKLNSISGKLQDIHYGDILIKYDSVIDAQKEKIPYIDVNVTGDFEKDRLTDGDVIIADTAEDETAGKVTEIENVGNKYLVSGLHTIPVRPKQNFAPYYLGYYLNSQAYHSTLLPLLQGIKVLSLSKSNISKTKVTFPQSVTEQGKIGKVFSIIDMTLTFQQGKINTLKLLKKFFLQTMFI